MHLSMMSQVLYDNKIQPNDTFGINPSSGEITLNQGLDYDVRDGRRYFLTIFAQVAKYIVALHIIIYIHHRIELQETTSKLLCLP